MPSYLNSNGNSIGSLLRFIQEQKSQSPIVPQGAEVGSPLRDVVQEPLKGSEGQGTSKVVSLRPEGTLTEGGEAIKQGTPQSSRIGPISIGGGDVGSIAPPSVVAANEPGTGFTIPSATRTAGDVMNRTGAASGAVSRPITPPSIGTVLGIKAPVTQSNKVYSSTGKDLTPAQEVLAITEQNQRFADEFTNTPTEKLQEKYFGAPTPTPTPAPGRSIASQYGGGANEASANKLRETLGVRTTYEQPKKSTPAVFQAPIKTIAPAVQKAAAPITQKVQQAAQKIAPVITQSPWAWLASKFR